MRRGQSTLEYVILLGFAAAGLIAMILYSSRGHQGHMRDQAEQLGARQYAPGNTRIKANQAEQGVQKEESAFSTTTTVNSQNPIGEINPELQGDPNSPDPVARGGLLGQIFNQWGYIYYLIDFWEQYVSPEGKEVAQAVAGGWWPWQPPAGGIIAVEKKIDEELVVLETLEAAAKKSNDDWPDREPNETSNISGSSEKGRIETRNHIDESLGDL